MENNKVISADSHVQEPKNLYERLPKKYRDMAPRVEVIDGGTYSIVEGKRPRRFDIAREAANEEDQVREFRDDPSGGTDLDRRLTDQKRDGVCAEVIYPNESLFVYAAPDPGYQFAVAGAYNDWAIELFWTHPNQFLPVAVLPVGEISAAVSEVERLAKLGYRSVGMPLVNRAQPYTGAQYEPLWSALADTNMVLSFMPSQTAKIFIPMAWAKQKMTAASFSSTW